MNIKDHQIYKENEQNIKHYTVLLAQALRFKKLCDSGKYKFECDKSHEGWHEWRTKKVNPETRILDKVLPYCYYCGEIDKTNTQTDTPIIGDKNWHDREIKLIPA